MKAREIRVPDPTRPNTTRVIIIDDLRKDYRNAPGNKEKARAERKAAARRNG